MRARGGFRANHEVDDKFVIRMRCWRIGPADLDSNIRVNLRHVSLGKGQRVGRSDRLIGELHVDPRRWPLGSFCETAQTGEHDDGSEA